MFIISCLLLSPRLSVSDGKILLFILLSLLQHYTDHTPPRGLSTHTHRKINKCNLLKKKTYFEGNCLWSSAECVAYKACKSVIYLFIYQKIIKKLKIVLFGKWKTVQLSDDCWCFLSTFTIDSNMWRGACTAQFTGRSVFQEFYFLNLKIEVYSSQHALKCLINL